MARFFLDGASYDNGDAILYDTAHFHALRLRVGDEVTLCDGRGTDHLGLITSLGRVAARVKLLSTSPSVGEPRTRLTVYLAFAKGERLDFAVQKCVELGAAAFVLFPSERAVARPEGKSLENRLARLNSIAKSAAEQAGRGVIPRVTAAETFGDAVTDAARADLPLFPYEGERYRGLLDTLGNGSAPDTVSIVTGAEGGFTPQEADAAVAAGMRSVTLGKRILRCDTAPVAVTASVMLWMGELG
ncbi:MAG: 16S rRNA (uracil(1498)-N(3))-methyltransferase [Oscillospiraceae bacterium]|jgi:16S rRNA (uracil1498-N3)-methyltransferase|nr:16S rRNA (uracil(1498)-N(3))-methyltransferase [Oscillospiraceae bacterium]